MTQRIKPTRQLFKQMKNTYRMVIMNEQTFEEKASFNLKPLNIFVAGGLLIITLITLTTLLIAFTPLREYIPGYSDVGMKRQLIALSLKADSMENTLQSNAAFIENIKQVINGNLPNDTAMTARQVANYDTIHQLNKTKEDSMLRKEIEAQDQYTLTLNNGSPSGISGYLFFQPVNGTVVSKFDVVKKHFGIDIVGKANEVIKAALDGTVILSDFTSSTGYVIGVQHANNMMTFYKHNSVLLKRIGERVKAGDAIAIIGNSGEQTTGPHLHFELWYNGSAIDPLRYISF
ncbi:MAG: hypothetical protein RIQ89_2341 [Bacteroidota bacterium]|jgi:murein DD-endopeptidase MepM/ murein hydrolase activator NlpD